ncbi:hypothetical protein M8J76_006241 [Diaphorina citri]|nr:hypothetical protein M8J76_006241 [Diaphorina citri]
MENEGDRKVNVVRRRLFVKHERDNSGSSHVSVTSEKRSSGVFSFFKWFKKSDEQISAGAEGKNSSLPASPTLKRNQSLSCGSLLSTATVSSFSFVNPGKYRPHVSLRQIHPGPDTDTYRNRIRQRDQLRELDKDLTLKKKYKLLGASTTSIYHSVENLATCTRPVAVMRSASLGRKKRKAPQPPLSEEMLLDVKTQRDLYGHRRTCSDSDGRRVHVKGKRKAPPPPTPTSSMNNTLSRSWRKKRPAPSLPFNMEEKSRLLHSLEKLKAHAEKQSSLSNSPLLGGRNSVCNDFLKLESGVLKAKEETPGPSSSSVKDRSVTPSSPVSPRPWYKRNRQPSYSEKSKVKDKGDDWLSEGNVQPRKNSVSEGDRIITMITQSQVVNGTSDIKSGLSHSIKSSDTKPSASDTKPSTSDTKSNSSDNHKRSHSFFTDGLKHSLSSSSCNSNASNPSPSRFSFFSKSSDDSKRRSQVSMLANISALDREAAEIIEREHQRQKALQELENAKYYSDIEVPVDHEYSEIVEENQVPEPKRATTRELISLFNAIGNVTRVTVNTTFFSRDTASNLFSRSDKKFNVNCKPSPNNKRREVFTKIENFDELEHWTESPRARRVNQAEQRSKLRLGFGEPYRPAGKSDRLGGDSDSEEEGVTIEELEDERVEIPSASKPESSRVPYKYHRSPSPSIPTILELSEHSSATTPASTMNPASEFSSLASTPLSLQVPSAPTLSNPRQAPHIAQLVWSCPQCTLENLKWKFVCDACNFFRPFSIEMRPKTTLGEPEPLGTMTADSTNDSQVNDSNIFGTESSNTNEESNAVSAGPGFCSRPSTTNAASKEPNRKAPYYMSDVLKSPDKQVSISDKLKALPATSILDPEPRSNPVDKKIKEASKENERIEMKEQNTKEMEELRKARLAFFDKTNREINTKPEPQPSHSAQPDGPINGDTKVCDKADLKKIKELLREIKHSMPQSSNHLINDYAVSESNDHEIKPFVKFENSKAIQKVKASSTTTSTSISQSKDSEKNVAAHMESSEETRHCSKATNVQSSSQQSTTVINNNTTEQIQQNKLLVNRTKVNGTNTTETKVIETKLNETNGLELAGAIKKTNNVQSVDDVEFDDNSLDRMKFEADKKAEIYLMKSKTILEDILVKKPTSKVSISVQTNSSVVRKSEITSSNPYRDAYNVSVPVVHEHYKIHPDGTLVTSLSKRNKMIGTGTFQLIRSRDFVGIEAMKTGRATDGAPTYANVEDESLSTSTCTSSTNCTSQVSSPHAANVLEERTSNLIRSKCFADFKARFVSSNNNVNTVAVNRLLKRLEAAIANGEHHKAASLAKELARLKIACSVTRQPTEDSGPELNSKHILVNMYVEDKVSHQGPIPLSVLSTMTVGQLKRKLEIEYEIPCRVQRWILGKSLGTNENATLEQMGVSENGTPVFLYLVAPEASQASSASTTSPVCDIAGPSGPPLSPDTHTASTSFGTLNSAESSRASSLERDTSEHHNIREDYIGEGTAQQKETGPKSPSQQPSSHMGVKNPTQSSLQQDTGPKSPSQQPYNQHTGVISPTQSSLQQDTGIKSPSEQPNNQHMGVKSPVQSFLQQDESIKSPSDQPNNQHMGVKSPVQFSLQQDTTSQLLAKEYTGKTITTQSLVHHTERNSSSQLSIKQTEVNNTGQPTALNVNIQHMSATNAQHTRESATNTTHTRENPTTSQYKGVNATQSKEHSGVNATCQFSSEHMGLKGQTSLQQDTARNVSQLSSGQVTGGQSTSKTPINQDPRGPGTSKTPYNQETGSPSTSKNALKQETGSSSISKTPFNQDLGSPSTSKTALNQHTGDTNTSSHIPSKITPTPSSSLDPPTPSSSSTPLPPARTRPSNRNVSISPLALNSIPSTPAPKPGPSQSTISVVPTSFTSVPKYAPSQNSVPVSSTSPTVPKSVPAPQSSTLTSSAPTSKSVPPQNSPAFTTSPIPKSLPHCPPSPASPVVSLPNSPPTSPKSLPQSPTSVYSPPNSPIVSLPTSPKSGPASPTSIFSLPSSAEASLPPSLPISREASLPSSPVNSFPSFDVSTLPSNSTLLIGWRCPLCTLMNSPTRPGCAACDSERPRDYRVPRNYAVSPNELGRLRTEEQIEKEVAAQKVANYEELVLLERADLVLNTQTFECPICFSECTPPNGAVLRECLHSFCKQCLVHTIQYNSEAVVKCPFRDISYSCDSILQEREIKALVSPEAYEQHLAKSIAHAEAQIQNAFHCKTPDCKGWCIFEDNVNEFRCPAIHDGLNCKQYQDHMKADSDTNLDARRTRDMLHDMVERGEAMACPQCHVVLMKKWGCDWLRCSMCKTEICWVTRGPRWGPNGKGDTTAGCKCGVNGIKCHPKCNYCH